MKESESKPYKVQGSRVYGCGWSYNLTNRTDAVHLCQTLNNYEIRLTENQNILDILKKHLTNLEDLE